MAKKKKLVNLGPRLAKSVKATQKRGGLKGVSLSKPRSSGMSSMTWKSDNVRIPGMGDTRWHKTALGSQLIFSPTGMPAPKPDSPSKRKKRAKTAAAKERSRKSLKVKRRK
tara:strand:+ start:35 stop:367 length:333 start_codon:yes stop_codon:yes gene_type:complete